MLDKIIVTSGDASAKTVSNATISSETLEAMQASSVPETLSILPNVDLKGGARSRGQSINIWGFGDQEDVRISFDGMQKDFEKYRQGTIFIDPELLKTIEVEKGSFSAESYGAFGGTVELISKSASDMLAPGQSIGAFTKLGVESNGNALNKTGAVYGRSEEHGAELLVSLTNRMGDNITTGDGETLLFSEGETWSGHFKGSLERGAHFFEMSGAFSNSSQIEPYDSNRGQVSVSSYLIDLYGYDEALLRLAVDRTTKDKVVSARYNYNPDNELIDLTIKGGWSQTDQHDIRPLEDQDPSGYIGGDENWLKYNTFNTEVKNTSSLYSQFGSDITHELSYGVQFQHLDRESWARVDAYADREEYNYGHYQLEYVPEGTETRWGIWTEYAVDIAGTFEIIPGIRYDLVRTQGIENAAPIFNNAGLGHDYSAVNSTGWSPSLRTLWKLNSNVSLFGDWAYKLRAPLIDELYDVSAWGDSSSLQLEAERVVAWRGGAVATFDDLIVPGDRLKTRASYFHNTVYDNIYVMFGGPNNDYWEDIYGYTPSYHNLRGYYTNGIELEAYYDSAYVFASMAYSVMGGKHVGTLRDMYGVENQAVSDISPTTLATVLGFKIPDVGFAMGWRAKYADSMTSAAWYDNYNDTKGYGVHDVFASWTPQDGRFEGLELRASVENMFDREYTPYLSLYPAKGRNLKASLSYKF
ncbi:TonB-dependent receptor [Roseibium sp. RKSG952]|uniref:TonB-dependent receptor domain-containing protein n=1 Tax=Roseibium sp. RKSG952 TaxID=2529384 RepID=UPI0018AD1AAF|nr:TonB-dependent receptor [Roseibium sp. RKSG952]